MSVRITAVTAVAIATAGFALAGCGSHSSSGAAPATAASASTAATKTGNATVQAIANCLRSHGADPTGMLSVLTTGTTSMTTAQLTALRQASAACASVLPARLGSRATSLTACLAGDGYQLTGSNPLSKLLSLDLTNAKVASDLQACVGGASAGPSSSS